MGDPNASLAAYNGFVAEGGTFEQAGNHARAIDCYTKALEAISVNGVLQDPIGINCLCSRSRCYLQLGELDAALTDAEDSLKENPEFNKGLFAKAEALYSKGEFEFALLNFHKGQHLRPDMAQFRLGVQKAREAIETAIGDTRRCQLSSEGDLTLYHDFVAEQEAARIARNKRGGKKVATMAAPSRRRPDAHRARSGKKPTSNVKQLLGELYTDREYLENLLADPSLKLGEGTSVKSLAKNGIQYLDKRTEFWRQQKPMYVRKSEQRELRSTKSKSKSTTQRMATAPSVDRVARLIEQAENLNDKGNFDTGLEKAEQAKAGVAGVISADKDLFVARVHNALGTALFATSKIDQAHDEFSQAVDVARNLKDPELLARSLSNLAKSHAAKGNFDAAVTCWSEAQPNITDRVEQSWLQHEMGRAHLEMGKADEALECGLAAERAANETGDQDWQLHSWILCAQANVALGGHQSALSYYEQAAQLAQRLHKSSLHDAIRQEMVLIEAQASAASVLDEDEDEETEAENTGTDNAQAEDHADANEESTAEDAAVEDPDANDEGEDNASSA